MLTYHAAAATDAGRRRTNEDAYLISSENGILALADGMGGPPAGEVASAIFVRAVDELAASTTRASEESAHALLQEAYRLAHQRMIDHVVQHPEHAGMGCTAELLVFSQDRYLLGHLGDSRSYLYRGGELRQLTRDHSFVQQMVEQGLISEAEAQHHAMKNVLLRTLGADLEPSFDLLRGSVHPGDQFLLSSDGLTEMLEDAGIAEILAVDAGLAEKVALLIEAAKAAGGSDNVTVVLCQAC